MDSRTIIEKVLAMMKDPTKSAMMAKIRISGWMNPSESLIDLDCSSRTVSPVTAEALLEEGSVALMASASWLCCWSSSALPPFAEPYTAMYCAWFGSSASLSLAAFATAGSRPMIRAPA
jgi:hypothetical protein